MKFQEFRDTVKIPFSNNGFSNFSFVAKEFAGTNTLRRILSLARKLGYRSMLVEEVEDDHPSKNEEDVALSRSEQRFISSKMYRLSRV